MMKIYNKGICWMLISAAFLFYMCIDAMYSKRFDPFTVVMTPVEHFDIYSVCKLYNQRPAKLTITNAYAAYDLIDYYLGKGVFVWIDSFGGCKSQNAGTVFAVYPDGGYGPTNSPYEKRNFVLCE